MNDDEIAAYAMSRTTLVVTYDGDRNPVKEGRATGFFLDAGDRQFAVTNSHVLEAYCSKRKSKEAVCLQVSVREREQGPEEHAGYFLMPTNEEEEGGVRSRYAFKDVGLVELCDDGARLVREHRKFVRLEDICKEPLKEGEEVIYRGYPEGHVVEFHAPIRSAWTEGYTQFTQIRAVSPRNLAFDRREGRVLFGIGKLDSARDLHGISGSALFDRGGRLRGVVWGGDGTHTWACPAVTLFECLHRYRAQLAR